MMHSLVAVERKELGLFTRQNDTQLSELGEMMAQAVGKTAIPRSKARMGEIPPKK